MQLEEEITGAKETKGERNKKVGREGKKERKRDGRRPPRTSYRLGKEHEISITWPPFHQTGTSSVPSAILSREAAMSPLTNDERDCIPGDLVSISEIFPVSS